MNIFKNNSLSIISKAAKNHKKIIIHHHIAMLDNITFLWFLLFFICH